MTGTAAAAAATLLVAACGGDGDAARAERYRKVIEDPSPRAQDVAEVAGAPDAVARAGDGSLLLTYAPSNEEDDEGPAAFAWRLRSPRGKKVAEHAEHTEAEDAERRFVGTPDGFVFVPPGEGADGSYFLDVRGTKHSVRVSTTPRRTAPGDVLVSAWEPTLAYRPATRSLAPVAGLPRGTTWFALDERGTGWAVATPEAERAAVVRVPAEGAPREARTHPLADGRSAAALAARAGTVAVALTRPTGTDAEGPVREVLLSTDNGKTWDTRTSSKRLPLGDLRQGAEAFDLSVLDDGRLLLGEEDGTWLLARTPRNDAFREISRAAPFRTVEAHGRTLYALTDTPAPSSALARDEGLWISRDDGRHWTRQS